MSNEQRFSEKFPRTYAKMINSLAVRVLVGNETMTGTLRKPDDEDLSVELTFSQKNNVEIAPGKFEDMEQDFVIEISVENLYSVQSLETD